MMYRSLQHGYSLIEVLIAMSIFTVGVTAVVLLTMDAQAVSRRSVERTQAIFFAAEGLEATRSIADAAFTNLIDGTHGLALGGTQRAFSGTTDTHNQFTRSVSVTQPGSLTTLKQVTSTVTWPITPSQSKSIQLTEYLTYWNHPAQNEIQCFHADLSAATIDKSSDQIIRNIWISNPSCGNSIALDKIILTWDIPGNNVSKVRIDNDFLWQGSAPSGTILDLVPNETFESGAPAIEIDQLHWTRSIRGTVVGVEFIMSDGSSEGFTIPAF